MKNYSVEIDGQKISVPDPVIISQASLKRNGAREKTTGVIIAYDPKTKAGAILVPGVDGDPRFPGNFHCRG